MENVSMFQSLVQIDWDSEASVWLATSEDVPGLVAESGTLPCLMTKLRSLVPELLEANAGFLANHHVNHQ